MGCSCTNNLKTENEKEVINDFELNKELRENNNNSNQIENILTDNNAKIENKENIIDSYLPKNSEIIIQNQKTSSEDKSVLKEKRKKNLSPFKPITTNKITKEELNNFFNEYTPLNDEVEVELRSPQLCENDAIYLGEWDIEKNLRHGRGIQIWPNNEKYMGYWKHDHSSGKGKLIHINGDIYEGEWEMDVPQGVGGYTKKNGEKYIGEWENGKQEGKGEEIWPDGSKYVGEYKNGKKSGHGVLNLSDGTFYDGNFENNFMHGKGKYKFSDNTTYEGDWVMNKIEGKGVLIWPDKKKYEGDFKDNKKDGYGTLTDTNGKKYRGEWKDDIRHGKGEKYFPEENIWKTGIWENGKRIKWIN